MEKSPLEIKREVPSSLLLSSLPILDLLPRELFDDEVKKLLEDKKFWQQRLDQDFGFSSALIALIKNPRERYLIELYKALIKDYEFLEAGRLVCLGNFKPYEVVIDPRVIADFDFETQIVGVLIENCHRGARKYLRERFPDEDRYEKLLILAALHQGDVKRLEETLKGLVEVIEEKDPIKRLQILYDEVLFKLGNLYPRSPEMIDHLIKLDLGSPGHLLNSLESVIRYSPSGFSLMKYFLTRYGDRLAGTDLISSRNRMIRDQTEDKRILEEVSEKEKVFLRWRIQEYMDLINLLQAFLAKRGDPRLLELLHFYQTNDSQPERKVLSLPSPGKVKSREELNSYLKQFCKDDALGISLESFEDLSYEDLRNIRLFHGTCFDLRDLWKWAKERIEGNRPVKDPYKNQPLSQEEIKFLERDYQRQIDAKAELKRPEIKFDEKSVVFHIDPVAVEGIDLPFYHLYITTPFTNINLGFIPEYTDPSDAWLNTSVILTNLRKLWEERRLLTVHSPNESIQCCTIHLKKSIGYWLTPEGNLNQDKLANMAQEIRDLL